MTRTALANWLETPLVRYSIIGVILFNAVILGLETSETVMSRAGNVIKFLDQVCLAIFVVELVLKLIALGPRFFRNGWNIFDFIIVGISLVPAAQGLSVLRALRILRVLRVISTAPSLRRVVEGLLTALPGMGSVFLLMALLFYIGSVIATKLFGEAFPDWFGNLALSAYSLFQIMTLESWSMGIVRPVMEAHPGAWLFFVPFIVITAFSVLNLFIGLLVNTMQSAVEDDTHEEFDRLRTVVRDETDAVGDQVKSLADEIKALRAEIAELRADRGEAG